MFCSPEAKFIVWLVGGGSGGWVVVAGDAYRPLL